MNKIQENLKTFMEDPLTNIVPFGTFRVKDFLDLLKIINNTKEDFLIYDNGGGRKFDIVFDRTMLNEKNEIESFPVKNFIEHLLSDHKSWIYCYQINNEQVVLKQIK